MSRMDYYLKAEETINPSNKKSAPPGGWNRAQPNSYYSTPLRTPVGVDALSPESDAVVSKKELKPAVAPIGTSPELERGLYFESMMDFPLNASYHSPHASLESSPRFPNQSQWSGNHNHNDYGGSLPNLPDFHSIDQRNSGSGNSNHLNNLNQQYQNNYLLASSYQSETMFDLQELSQQRRRTISWDTGNEDPSTSAIPPRIFDLFSSPTTSSEQYSYLVQAISPKNPAGHLYKDSNVRYRSTGSLDDGDSFQQSFENMSIEDQQWPMSPPMSHFSSSSKSTHHSSSRGHAHPDHSSNTRKEPLSPPFPDSPSSSFNGSGSLSASFSSPTFSSPPFPTSSGSSSPTPIRDKTSSGSSYGEHPHGEHPSRTLFVRNISSNVDDEELRSLFEAYGPLRGMYTQCKHRGFVMISYYDIRHAKNAMRHLQNKVLRRRKLDIHYSIPKSSLSQDNPSEKDQNQGTLVVFNLDPSVTNEELKDIFGAYGEIKEIRETPNKKHHKFIEFYDVRDAEEAMKHLNKTEIRSKKIKIEPSRPGGIRKNLAHSLATEVIEDNGSPTPLSPLSSQRHATPPSSTSIHDFISLSSSAPGEHQHMKNMSLGASMGLNSGNMNSVPNQSVLMNSQDSLSKDFSPHNNSFQYTSPFPPSSPFPGNNMNWPATNKHNEEFRPFSIPFSDVSSKIPKYDVNSAVGSSLTGIRARSRSDSGEDQSQYILEIDRVMGGVDKRTTLMIKNIPNKYTQKMLLSTMDERFKGQYDFFYLPIDFKNKCNVGYAFINFIKYDSIAQFYTEYNGKKWEKFNSDKVCVITYARIQGKGALIAHFQNSSLMCEDKKCRPIIFHSDGPSLGEQEPFPVGPNLRTRRVSGSGKEEVGRVGFPGSGSPGGPSSAQQSSTTLTTSASSPAHHIHPYATFTNKQPSNSIMSTNSYNNPSILYSSYGTAFRDDQLDDLTMSF